MTSITPLGATILIVLLSLIFVALVILIAVVATRRS